MPEDKRRTLLENLSRSIAYAVPVVAIVALGATSHAIYSDLASESGYQMMAEGEAEAEGEGEGEGEGKAEGEGEAEAEAEGDA